MIQQAGRILLAALCLCAGLTPRASAGPTLTYAYPAGASRGQTVTVTLGGKFDHWPVQVWTDSTGVKIEARKDKGTLTVSVNEDAAIGPHWFRVYDDTGASVMLPFVVGTLPGVLEKETNDLPTAPQTLDGPATIDGRLAKRNDVDTYAIAAKKGQTIVAAMLAHRTLGSPMDGLIQVCAADGTVLEQNDDGYGLDPLIAYAVPADGTYLVRTFAFPATPDSSINFAGGDDFIYRLTITTGPFVDHTLPLATPGSGSAATELQLFGWNLPEGLRRLAYQGERQLPPGVAWHAPLRRAAEGAVYVAQNTAPDHSLRVQLPCDVTGRIDRPGDTDVIEFEAHKGKAVECRLESRAIGFALDAVLRVEDASGKTEGEVDDTNKEPDPTLAFTPPADGLYRLRVSDLFGHGGFRFVYHVAIGEVRPDFALTLKAGEFVLKPGKPLEIPIDVERRHGFAGPIEVAVEGLPEGVTAKPVTSEPKGATAKSVKLKLEAADKAKPFNGPVTITGRSGEGDARPQRNATFTIAGDNKSDRAWLTVAK
jgi:hypothetical protein